MARHCDAMRIFKSKCTKHTSFRALYEVGMRNNGTPLWCEAHVHVKMHKTHQRRTTCGSWDRKKWHAILARSKFSSQKIQNTPASMNFMKLGCGKMARRCGAKHICKSKRTKHTSFGPLLEVCMWKLVRRCGAKHSADLEKLHAAVARSTFPLKTCGLRSTFGGIDVEKVSERSDR